MKMTKTIQYLLLLLAVVSCTTVEPCQKCHEAEEAQTLKRVSVSLVGEALYPTTKSVSRVEDECHVNSCQLYIFSGGRLLNRFVSEGTDFEFFINNGIYNIYAFVNAPELELNPSSEDEFLARHIPLTDNRSGNFVMTGSALNTSISESSNIDITVARMVSKVNFSVRVDITNEVLRGLDFKVLSVYMTNVVGEQLLSLQDYVPSDSLWYNKRNYEPSRADTLLYAPVGELVPSGDSLRTKSTFYVFPNRCKDPDDRKGWSPRKTRFVVEAMMGDQLYYYPVTIPKVVSNCEYIITVDVKSIGYLDPEDTEETPIGCETSIVIIGWYDGDEIDFSR